jgi:hypothetical protein
LIKPVSHDEILRSGKPTWIWFPWVNSQASSREELLSDLRSALEEALELNRADAIAAAEGSPYEEVRLHVAA